MLIPSFNYPYPSILELYPYGIDDNLASQLTEKWERAFVSFHAPKPNSRKETLTMGSGFLMLLGGNPFIVTASHVIDDLKDLDSRYFRVEDKVYPFEKVSVFFNSEQDYAFIELPKEMLTSEKGFIFFTDSPRTDLIPTSSMIISGFPSSKNKIHKDRPGKVLQRFNFVHHHFEYNTLNEELHFPFDSRQGKGTPVRTEPASTFSSVPLLEGMSGAPVLQIMQNIHTEALTLRVVGIFKEHRSKTEKCLVASTFIHFAEETNNILDIKSPYK
ncbi:serine protease [Citrobacter sp. Cpo074]|uniref:S1 family peptidase n=1 Tax=Citrobacter sp. Cpo074 TaxID=2985135 RepID=UPI00257622DB|nr:serine protease [Citrobacter sp. Cpo074]MDM2848775.1 serine protease [Citrobacter sp. Cpo074]